MRRDNRMKETKKDFKSGLYVSGGILIISIIAFIITFVAYTNKLNNNTAKLNTQKIAELVPNETESTEASSQMGKTVKESENELQENNLEASNANIVENTNTIKTNTQIENKTSEKTTKTTSNTEEKKEEVKDPEFIKPVDGEIIKGFASENLVYSETLQEWTTHNGIDIAAEKTTVVQASAEGTVTAIKNDPRYGTTVIIEHTNGFETRYSNLLTAEFVVAGEKVEKGQSIGTVGNSAMFEVADASHLHFEILKDSEALNPENYIK